VHNSSFSLTHFPWLSLIFVLIVISVFLFKSRSTKAHLTKIRDAKLPATLDIHYSNTRLLIPAAVGVVAIGILISAYILAQQEPEKALSILLFAGVICILTGAYTAWVVWNFLQFSTFGSKPYIQMTQSSITLMGIANIPWNAVTHIEMMEWWVLKDSKHFLVLHVTANQQQLLDPAPCRDKITWPRTGVNQVKLPYNEKVSLQVDSLTIGTEAIHAFAEKYWEEATAGARRVQ